MDEGLLCLTGFNLYSLKQFNPPLKSNQDLKTLITINHFLKAVSHFLNNLKTHLFKASRRKMKNESQNP